MDHKFNIFFILDSDVRWCSFLDDYEVTCWFNRMGSVKIERVRRFHERFQTYSDITVDILSREKEFKKLKEELEDWFIGHQFETMKKSKEYEPEDEIA